MAVNRDSKIDHGAGRPRGWVDLAVGLVLFTIGAIVFVATFDAAAKPGSSYLIPIGPLVVGGSSTIRGIWRLIKAPPAGAVSSTGLAQRTPPTRGMGYKSFVAWRYLLVADTKVTQMTRLLTMAGIAVACVLALLRAGEIGWPEMGWLDPVLVAQLSALGFVFVVVFLGVLRHSRVALVICSVGLGLMVISGAVMLLLLFAMLPGVHREDALHLTLLQVSNLVAIGGGVLAGLAMFFGCLRAFFTFFTTVPIGGVWVGTSALVIVLAVMSGFETDLRQKIVGSNAHLQIVREGDFVDWRAFKAKLDQLPGVVASTPFVVSEVVVAANNQGMNVIIKGIDPDTVGKVTDLLSNLKDSGGREAMQRLAPIVPDARDLSVPQQPRTGPVVDPPPDDMPTPGVPIDFSGAEPAAALDERPAADPAGPAGAGGKAPPSHPHDLPGHGTSAPGHRYADRDLDATGGVARHDPASPTGDHGDAPGAGSGAESFGGDARALIDEADQADEAGSAGHAGSGAGGNLVDPPPRDLVTSDEPPADYSQPDYAPETVIKVTDLPFEAPSASPRTLSLPGILVGKELVKQTHLYTGEEVRVVSPLSDPSNPDATGTPIPFNRYYRVAGTFFTGMYEYDLKYVYVSIDSLQDFLDRGDAIDGIEVRLANPDSTDAFMATFRAAFGTSYRVQDWKELNRSLFSALKLEKVAMFLVLGIVILVASFSIIGNLIMVVVEKAREIALLKTLGASDVGVMQLFAIQGLMIGLIGTVLGVATGLLVCWGAKRFGLPLNPDVYYIDRLPVHVDPMSVVAAASAGVLISIAATLYPAVVAARVRPAAGMRH